MKKIFLFSTRLRVYWVLMPILALLALCIRFNSKEAGMFMLYPLIILLIGSVIFIFIYFWRAVSLSYDEIRHVGLFSGRDSAVITEGKTLILEKIRGGRLHITLFGNDGVLPELNWMKSTAQAPRDISLFRGKVIWYRYSVKRILSLFGVSGEDCEKILLGDLSRINTEIATVTQDTENGHTKIRVRINKTI